MEHVATLEKGLESAQENAHYFPSQESTAHNVLSRRLDECNKLKDANMALDEEKNWQGLELEKLKSRVAIVRIGDKTGMRVHFG